MRLSDVVWGRPALGKPPRRNRPVLSLLLIVGVSFWASGFAHAAVTYTPRIEGVEDSKLIGTLEALSQLFSLKDKPPDTVIGLDQRARADLDRLKPALQGAGYWEAELDYAIDENVQPVAVTITVRPGPLYRLAKVELKTPTNGVPPPLADPSPEALELKLGEPALTQAVVNAEAIIAERYADEGRPFAKVVGREVSPNTRKTRLYSHKKILRMRCSTSRKGKSISESFPSRGKRRSSHFSMRAVFSARAA